MSVVFFFKNSSFYVTMHYRDVYKYYSQDFVIEQLLKNARGREIAGALRSGNYDQRPNILEYKNDVLVMVRKGVTSFHLSVEYWKNPMQISASRTKNYDELRNGWDLVIDMDSKLGIEAAKIAAIHVCDLLEKYGIRKYGIKFSGSRGFHICVPWVSFPGEVDYKSLAKMYPRAPRILASFIRSRIADNLMKDLLKQEEARKMMEALGEIDSPDPFYFVELEKDWGARHMFRAPFSLNEKTWLVSIPLTKKQIESFNIEAAQPFSVKEEYPDFFAAEENQAEQLLLAAMDWYSSQRKEQPRKIREIRLDRRVPERNFPPCIKNILKGLDDGKKRSLFTLVNFLRLMNWKYDEIEERMLKWNEKNSPPLQRSMILGSVRYHHQNPHTTANCFNDQFYASFGACQPDATCKKINAKRNSNPLSYPFRGMSAKRGFSCLCGKEFKTYRALETHKSRVHQA